MTIKDDGSADLSALPENLREMLEAHGVKDETGYARVLPKEGERFLKLLMRYSGRQWYCGTTPEPQDE